MDEVRFLLDENVNPTLASQLLSRAPSITVWRVGLPGAPPLGTFDPEILIWCEENKFVLVTNNRKSMPVHLQKHLSQKKHVPGILILNEKMTFGETIEELLLIFGASSADEYQDRIAYLPIT